MRPSLAGSAPRSASICQLLGDALVSVNIKDPWITKLNTLQCPVLLLRKAVEPAIPHLRPGLIRNGDRCIGAIRIKNMNIIRPTQRLHARGQIALFILGQNQNRDHSSSTSEVRLLMVIINRRRQPDPRLCGHDAAASPMQRRRCFPWLNGEPANPEFVPLWKDRQRGLPGRPAAVMPRDKAPLDL